MDKEQYYNLSRWSSTIHVARFICFLVQEYVLGEPVALSREVEPL